MKNTSYSFKGVFVTAPPSPLEKEATMAANRFSRLTLVILTIFTLIFAGCGGGGGGGEAGVQTQLIISGTVQAPNAQLAFYPQLKPAEKIADLFISRASAALTGINTVADGTQVELVRINDAGIVVSSLAKTTTSGGKYAFNLTQLGVSISSDLLVRVANLTTGVQMRSFVTGITVNVDPVSETTVRVVLEQIVKPPGSSLASLTAKELADLVSGIDLLTSAKQSATGANLEETVIAIKNAVTADTGLTAFVASAAGAGQTTEGTGDVGQYFPFEQGNTYIYRGTITESGAPSVSFSNTIQVTGTRLVNGVTATVFTESNPENSGQIRENYLLKDSRGIGNRGNNEAADVITPQLVPFQEVLFPLQANFGFEQLNKTGLDFGSDLDGDGRNERFELLSRVTIVGFETVTVPSGTFSSSARTQTTTTFTVILSSNGAKVTITGGLTDWFAPGVGLVKSSSEITGNGQSTTETAELTGFVVNGTGNGTVNDIRQITLATNDIIYNPFTGKIYASVPSRAGGTLGNSVTVIDPATGIVGQSVFVGSEPGKLAFSDDGRFLYVALAGSAAVRVVDFLTPETPQAGLQFLVGSDPFFGSLFVEDMEVLPGNTQAVAISRKNAGFSPRHMGVAIYISGIKLTTETPGHTGSNVIEFSASASALYGYNNETTDFGFRRMVVDAAGVSIIDSTPNLISGFGVDITFDGGRIYATTGQVVDPEARTLLGTFSGIQFGSLVKPDSAIGRTFFLTDGFGGNLRTLRAFDQNTFLPLGTMDIQSVSGTPGSLVRWGTNGLAFRTDSDQVFLIRTSLIP